MEVKGTMHKLTELETGTSKAGKEWKKRSLVVDTGDQYNPHVAISFFGNKVDLLDNLTEGQELTVSINLSSREFSGKWYNSIDGWKIGGQSAEVVTKGHEATVEGDLPF